MQNIADGARNRRLRNGRDRICQVTKKKSKNQDYRMARQSGKDKSFLLMRSI